MSDNRTVKPDLSEAAAYRYGGELPLESRMLEELLKGSEIQQLFETYYKLIKIPVAIIDLKANVLLSSRWQRICTHFHRVNPDTCRRCVESDTTIATQLTQGRQHAIFPCQNGLTDCASPIIIDGKYVANVFIGQFMTRKPDEERFRRQAAEFGFPAEDYLAAAREVPVVDEERVPLILDLLARMTRVITNLSVERKRAAEAQARQSLVLNAIPQGVFWKDPDGIYLGCNKAFAEAAGLPAPEAVEGKTDFDLPWEKKDSESYRAADRAVASSGKPMLHIIEPLRGADGSRRILDTSKIPLPDAAGAHRGVLGIFQDITEQKKLADELEESRAMFQAIVEGTQDFIWTVDPVNFGILTANTAFRDYFRRTRGITDLAGKRPEDLFSEGFFRDWWRNAFEKAARDGRYSSEYTTYKAGIVMLLELTLLKKEGRPFAISVLGKNITDRKRAEEELQASKVRWESVFNSSPAPIVVARASDGRYVEVNPAWEEITGYTRQEAVGRTGQELGIWVKPTDRGRLYSETRESGKGRIEIQIRNKNGQIKDLVISSDTLELAGEKFVVTLAQDITERKEAERALKESLTLTNAIFENSQDMIWAVDPEEFGLLSFNKALHTHFLGKRGLEIRKGMRPRDMFPDAEHVKWWEAAYRQALREGGCTLEYAIAAAGKTLLSSFTILKDEKGIYAISVFAKDITDRKLAAERLSVATRAAKIGIWDWNVEKNELVWDDGMYALYHIRREDFAGAYEAWASNVHPEDKARVDGDIQAALRGEREYAPEFRITWPDGEVRTIKAESRTLRGPDGKVLRMVGTNIDVTESRVAEQKLRDNELKYRALFETADDAILLFADGKWIDCNKAAGRVFGCAREQILGAHPKKFSPPTQPDGKDSMEEAPRLIGLAYEGKPQSFSWTHCRLDGTPFFAEVNLNRVDLAGKAHIQAIVRDITARRLAEEALRESEEKFRLAFSTGLDAFYWASLEEGRIIEINPVFEQLFGYSKPEVIGKTSLELGLYHMPADRARMVSELKANGYVRDMEVEGCRKGGSVINVSMSVSKVSVHGKNFIIGALKDITARKASESRQALYLSVLKRLGDGEASDEVISDILAYVASSLGIEAVGIRIERNGDFPFLSARGYTPDFMEKERTLCTRGPSGEPARDPAGNVTLECLCGGVIRGSLGHELPFVTKGGSLWLNSTSSLTREEVGAVAAHLINFRGRCVDVGFESLALIPLRSKGNVIGLLHLADHRKDRLSLELVEFLEGLGSSIAVVMQRKEAEAAKARLQEELSQAQKMESIGRLAGGVAHDFNNILTAISGYGDMLMRALAIDDPKRADMAEILTAARRASDLTRQLLAFSRKQILTPEVLDLNTAVEGMVKMLKRVIGEDIRLETRHGAAPCFVRMDSGQLGQVLMNLSVNARDAMPRGGALTIATERLEMPGEFFNERPDLKRGPLVRLSVSDTGTGMSREVLAHIMEPFFTTKEKGKGTGLGVPTVHGIVSQSGGVMNIRSEEGKGSVFELYFPAAEKSAPRAEPKPEAAAGFAGGGETILVVEDEESLRVLAERILKSAGYKVISAAGGKEALEKAKLAPEIDMLITDVVMPGMSGKEVAETLARSGIVHSVLYSSGYNDEILARHGELPEGVNLLEKPYSPESLLRRVRGILDAAKRKK